MPITDFLTLNIPKDKLSTALEVLQKFKEQESTEEWLQIPFDAWAKLEQLEEYLEHLVNDKPLNTDTIAYIERMKDKKTEEPKIIPEQKRIQRLTIKEWKPTATDQTCKLLRCKGCHEQLRPTPCDRWYFEPIYLFFRTFNWR